MLAGADAKLVRALKRAAAVERERVRRLASRCVRHQRCALALTRHSIERRRRSNAHRRAHHNSRRRDIVLVVDVDAARTVGDRDCRSIHKRRRRTRRFALHVHCRRCVHWQRDATSSAIAARRLAARRAARCTAARRATVDERRRQHVADNGRLGKRTVVLDGKFEFDQVAFGRKSPHHNNVHHNLHFEKT